MKKHLFIATLIAIASCGSNASSNEDILKSNDIQKIEAFLKTAHPDDPRKPVLKKKLIELKNKEWTKGRETHKPMQARVETKETPKAETPQVSNNTYDAKKEAEEFKKLMQQEKANKKDNATKALNQIFDNDPSSKEAYVMVQNKSNCDMVLKIQGEKEYKMPIPAQGQNSIVLQKGTYTLTGNPCGVPYSSTKNIQKSTMLTLSAGIKSTTTEVSPTPAKPATKKTASKKRR